MVLSFLIWMACRDPKQDMRTFPVSTARTLSVLHGMNVPGG